MNDDKTDSCTVCGKPLDQANPGYSRYLGGTLIGHFHAACEDKMKGDARAMFDERSLADVSRIAQAQAKARNIVKHAGRAGIGRIGAALFTMLRGDRLTANMILAEEMYAMGQRVMASVEAAREGTVERPPAPESQDSAKPKLCPHGFTITTDGHSACSECIDV